MGNNSLQQLREQLDQMNLRILELINERGKMVGHLEQLETSNKIEEHYALLEQDMMSKILTNNYGPVSNGTIHNIFKEIFKSKSDFQEKKPNTTLLVSRSSHPEDTIIKLGQVVVGDGDVSFIMGPCAVENYEQVAKVAEQVKRNGVNILRAGAFKPRTSPYDFQGLGIEGMKILSSVGKKFNMAVVSEVMSPGDVEPALEFLDMIQIGARNMQNFDLLKEVGATNKPIFLKRGLSATIKEFINAAEYIMSRGNGQIIMCERGIRTFEQATRNTLDISAVPILKQETHLPVYVDVTHSTGRRDLLIPAAKAAIAVGADGIMAEVHPNPIVALSDAEQQMDFNQFEHFIQICQDFSKINGRLKEKIYL